MNIINGNIDPMLTNAELLFFSISFLSMIMKKKAEGATSLKTYLFLTGKAPDNCLPFKIIKYVYIVKKLSPSCYVNIFNKIVSCMFIYYRP